MHQAATQDGAMAKTWVIWDIKSCPVPFGFDAHRIALCIKRALEYFGFSGPLSITAIGHLLDIPEEVLRSISSTGISLHHIPLDVVSILDAMHRWGIDNLPPANVLLLTARDFSEGLNYLESKKFNILQHILYDDSLGAFPTATKVERLWKSFLTDSMDSEEKFSDTSDWLCTVCVNDAGKSFAGKDFNSFVEHLRSHEHRCEMLEFLPLNYKLRREKDEEVFEDSPIVGTLMLNRGPERKVPTREEAEARTWVIWDMKSCPVPSACDARRVSLCIKRALERLGYSGLLSITAIGHLTNFSEDVLRSLSSTGISLYHIPSDIVSIVSAIYDWGWDNLPLANVLLISTREMSGALNFLLKRGFNILRQILYDDSRGAFPTSTEVEHLWKSFLTDTKDSEEKSSETSESIWFCTVCRIDTFTFHSGEGFENLIKHLWSREHRCEMVGFLPCDYELKREETEEEIEAARMKLSCLLNPIPTMPLERPFKKQKKIIK